MVSQTLSRLKSFTELCFLALLFALLCFLKELFEISHNRPSIFHLIFLCFVLSLLFNFQGPRPLRFFAAGFLLYHVRVRLSSGFLKKIKKFFSPSRLPSSTGPLSLRPRFLSPAVSRPLSAQAHELYSPDPGLSRGFFISFKNILRSGIPAPQNISDISSQAPGIRSD